jgi:hypothetical protein
VKPVLPADIQAEIAAYSKYLNLCLHGACVGAAWGSQGSQTVPAGRDTLKGIVPLNPDGDDLLNRVHDGASTRMARHGALRV